MSVQINSNGRTANLYCSCSGWAFGPIFEGDDPEGEAASFLEWIGVDPRCLSDDLLVRAKQQWHRTHLDENGAEMRETPLADDDSIAVLRELQQAEHEFERRRKQRPIFIGAAANAGART